MLSLLLLLRDGFLVEEVVDGMTVRALWKTLPASREGGFGTSVCPARHIV